MTGMRVSLVLVAICSLLAFAPDTLTARLAFDRDAILTGQIWRLWTGHWVHFSWQHALSDMVFLFVASSILERHAGSRVIVSVLIAGALLISLGLLLTVTDLQIYQGASGMAMLIGVMAGHMLWRADPRLRSSLALLAAGLLAKLLIDASGTMPNLSMLPAGVQLAWQAHAIGAIVGGVFALHPVIRHQREHA